MDVSVCEDKGITTKTCGVCLGAEDSWRKKLKNQEGNEIEHYECKGSVGENIIESCSFNNFKIIDIVVKFCQTI